MNDITKLLGVTPGEFETTRLAKRSFSTQRGVFNFFSPTKTMFKRIVFAGVTTVPEKERAALRNFNIISLITMMMVIVFGGVIYLLIPSTSFLIALMMESGAFAFLIYLNHRGKFNYSKVGMYLTHSFSAVFLGSWLGEAMPLELIAAFLFVYLTGSSCQVYKQWRARVGFIVATVILCVIVYLNHHYNLITPQHFPHAYLPLISTLCCGGMMVLMLFVTLNMIRQNDKLTQGAEAASLQKTRYVQETSHELRTPLNTIVGNAECLIGYEKQLLSLTDGTDIVEMIRHLYNSSLAMRNIINNQLDMAKIEAGKFDEVALTSFSLNDLLDKSIHQHISVARGRGVKIRSCYDAAATDVKSDQLFLLKITNNLLSNAIKFTKDNSEVCVTTRLDGEFLELTFTNESYIPKEKIARLFKEYEAERNVQTAGSGLGLTITRKLVQYLNGNITVRTEAHNTHFVVRIPYMVPDKTVSDPLVMADNHTVTLSTSVAGQNNWLAEDAADDVRFAGVKVLIAEDDEMNQKILERILRQTGAIVACADNAEEAIALLGVFEPDVIISDNQMPGIGGLGLLKYLNLSHLQVPFIMASGDTSADDLRTFFAGGAAAHILKPIVKKDLVAALTGVLERYELIH